LFSESLSRALLLGALLAGIVLHRSPKTEVRQFAQLLALALLVFILIYLIQGKGWIYQRVPIWYACATIIAYAIGIFITEEGGTISRRSVIVPLVLLMMQVAMVPRLHAYIIRGLPQLAESPLSLYFRTHSKPGERIAVLSTVVAPGSEALLYSDRLPAIRYLCAFPLPLAYTGMKTYAIANDRKRMVDDYYASLLADLRKFTPPIIAIDTLWYFRNTPDGFTMKAWLQQQDFYSILEQKYQRVAPVMNFEMYERHNRVAQSGDK
jgi:hypothetical protein